MKKMKNYLKYVSLFIGTSLLLWNCQKEEVLNTTQLETNSIKVKTVSLEDAKNLFQTFEKNQPKAKGNNNLVVTPDWNTLNQESLFYTDAMLTKVDVKINREGNFTTEILFIEVNGEMKNVIYTLYIDSMTSNGNLKNARVYLTELNGDYIDGYGFENGLITTRFLPKKEINAKSSKNIAARYDYPTSFWGESMSPSTGGSGDPDGGGAECADCVQLDVVIVKGYLKDPYSELIDPYSELDGFFNPINEFTDIDNLNPIDDTTSGISTSTIKEVTTAVVIDPVVKCDPGFMLINGDCVVDTETPCDKPGFVKDENGICGPAPDQINNNLTGKANCVYEKLIRIGVSDYHNLITDLFIEFGEDNIGNDNIYFEMNADLPDETKGNTLYDVTNNAYIVQINSNTMNSISSMEMATVLVHEIAHAFLGKHYNNSTASFNVLYQQYRNENGLVDYSHDIMKDSFIKRIANVIFNFDNTLFTNYEDYQIIAALGLYEFSLEEKNQFNNAIKIARENDKNCLN